MHRVFPKGNHMQMDEVLATFRGYRSFLVVLYRNIVGMDGVPMEHVQRVKPRIPMYHRRNLK